MRITEFNTKTKEFVLSQPLTEKATNVLIANDSLLIILVHEKRRFMAAAGFIDLDKLGAGSKTFLLSALEEEDPDDPGVSVDLKATLDPVHDLSLSLYLYLSLFVLLSCCRSRSRSCSHFMKQTPLLGHRSNASTIPAAYQQDNSPIERR